MLDYSVIRDLLQIIQEEGRLTRADVAAVVSSYSMQKGLTRALVEMAVNHLLAHHSDFASYQPQ